MQRKVFKLLATLGVALALVAMIAPRAEAAFIVAICNDAGCAGGGDILVADGGVGDSAGLSGIILAAGTVGGYGFALNTSQTKPAFGSAANPSINLTYSLNGNGNIWLYAGDTDFTGQGNATLTVNSTTASQTTTAWGMGGDDNLVDGNGLNLSPAFITIGPTAGVFNVTLTDGPVGAAPYALAVGIEVNRVTQGTSAGDATLTVPEPATMGLFGLALFGLGGIARRRFAR